MRQSRLDRGREQECRADNDRGGPELGSAATARAHPGPRTACPPASSATCPCRPRYPAGGPRRAPPLWLRACGPGTKRPPPSSRSRPRPRRRRPVLSPLPAMVPTSGPNSAPTTAAPSAMPSSSPRRSAGPSWPARPSRRPRATPARPCTKRVPSSTSGPTPSRTPASPCSSGVSPSRTTSRSPSREARTTARQRATMVPMGYAATRMPAPNFVRPATCRVVRQQWCQRGEKDRVDQDEGAHKPQQGPNRMPSAAPEPAPRPLRPDAHPGTRVTLPRAACGLPAVPRATRGLPGPGPCRVTPALSDGGSHIADISHDPAAWRKEQVPGSPGRASRLNRPSSSRVTQMKRVVYAIGGTYEVSPHPAGPARPISPGCASSRAASPVGCRSRARRAILQALQQIGRGDLRQGRGAGLHVLAAHCGRSQPVPLPVAGVGWFQSKLPESRVNRAGSWHRFNGLGPVMESSRQALTYRSQTRGWICTRHSMAVCTEPMIFTCWSNVVRQ